MTGQKKQLEQALSEGQTADDGVCSVLCKFALQCSLNFTGFCRESEATANLGAVLTGSTLVTMFVVRKLGLTLAELDDVTSGITSVSEAKANVSAFGNAAAGNTSAGNTGAPGQGANELRKDL